MVFNVDERIYDTLNYNEGIITNIENDIITYRDNNFNNHKTKVGSIFKVNEGLSKEFNILICNNNTENDDRAYFIPMANKAVYAFELKEYSQLFS